MKKSLEKLKHDFEPRGLLPVEGKYCAYWEGATKVTKFGTLSFRSQCGYPEMAHQDSPKEWR